MEQMRIYCVCVCLSPGAFPYVFFRQAPRKSEIATGLGRCGGTKERGVRGKEGKNGGGGGR